MEHVEISVVIPVFNEQDVLPQLYERVNKVLAELTDSYEVIFINDGSTDYSLATLKEFSANDKRAKILSFSRNFGHQVAISAGLNFSSGLCVAVMDGDLQDPPELLKTFIKKWKAGYHVVYAVRKKRKEGILKRMAYKIYYRLLRKVSGIGIPLDSGDFCLMDRKVVDLLNSLPERNRFVRGLRSWVGFRQVGVEYDRDARHAGKPKYTFSKLLRLGIDGLISFSYLPLKVAIYLGLTISLLSIGYALYIAICRIVLGTTVEGWTSIVVGISFLSGIQLLVLGFIGEYIGRIFDEVKRRPLYILSESIGFGINYEEIHSERADVCRQHVPQNSTKLQNFALSSTRELQ